MSNNPFKIIGLAFLISIISVFGLPELATLFSALSTNEWLLSAAVALLMTIAMLLNLWTNTLRLKQLSQQKAKA